LRFEVGLHTAGYRISKYSIGVASTNFKPQTSNRKQYDPSRLQNAITQRL
jgi:hypothetical protein